MLAISDRRGLVPIVAGARRNPDFGEIGQSGSTGLFARDHSLRGIGQADPGHHEAAVVDASVAHGKKHIVERAAADNRLVDR